MVGARSALQLLLDGQDYAGALDLLEVRVEGRQGLGASRSRVRGRVEGAGVLILFGGVWWGGCCCVCG